MVRSFNLLLAASLCACASLGARVASAARSVAALAIGCLRYLAEPHPFRSHVPNLADVMTLPHRAYVGPPAGLRFEAGRSSLAAARNI